MRCAPNQKKAFAKGVEGAARAVCLPVVLVPIVGHREQAGGGRREQAGGGHREQAGGGRREPAGGATGSKLVVAASEDGGWQLACGKLQLYLFLRSRPGLVLQTLVGGLCVQSP